MAENNKEDVISIVIHGRGGMGVVTCAEIIAEAAYLSGNFVDVHAYPSFGAERRGAPIQAYCRLSRKEKIWDRAQIENPNILIILDETILNQNIASSLKDNGILIINSEKEPKYFADKFNLSNIKIIVADLNKLALEKGLTIDGAPIINTPILGLLSKSLTDLSLDNLNKIVQKRMSKEIGKLNIELIEEGYKLAKIL
ncbi:MAG: pyruvate ferredoxin oxidoreductase [Promethearchaeota archaeon]|nr:MAG: pyruvate ferredoxin oxidoreductase [Candidatus Lokiarchaeota archaeon]